MDALVLIRYRIRDVCEPEDLTGDLTLHRIVTDMIETEGISGIADDDVEIVSIKVAR